MNDFYLDVFAFYFTAGIVIASLFLLQIRYKLEKSVFFLLLFCLAVFSLDTDEQIYSLSSRLIIYGYTYGFFFSTFYRGKLMPTINEKLILELNLVYLYALSIFVFQFTFLKWLIIFSLIPSLLTLIIAFFDTQLNLFFKNIFYFWFLFMSLVLVILQTPFLIISNIFGKSFLAFQINPWQSFIAGFNFIYLMLNVNLFLDLLPLPAKHQTFSARWQELKNYINEIGNCYDSKQLTPVFSFTIIFIQAGLLIFNYFFQAIPHFLMISLSLLVLPQVLMFIPVKQLK